MYYYDTIVLCVDSNAILLYVPFSKKETHVDKERVTVVVALFILDLPIHTARV